MLLDETHAACPVCDGPGKELGFLGQRIWYRCESCGMDFSHLTEEEWPRGES